MKARVGINGFGRMGRLGFRAGWGSEDIEFFRVNEIACDAHGSAHLLKYDSVQGKFAPKCAGEDDALFVEGQHIFYSSNLAIQDTDWSSCDIVIEATGKFCDPEQLQAYFDQGVKKVVVAAPVKGALNLVYGVNDHLYSHEQHQLVTAASCTTNCLAPIVKVMQAQVGIVRGTMTTIHDITATQNTVDHGHKDLRRARACGQSLIPTSTSSAKAITEIFPELSGKLNGLAVRVPLLNASLVDFVFQAERPVTVEEINGYLREASKAELKGILGYEKKPLVSVDFKGNKKSAIIDALSTMVIDESLVKILAWYDNEWGYANRLIDITEKVARMMHDEDRRNLYRDD